ncbi:hypothetical protein WJX72_006055 [[Myrmecia] bisecta]|uniref:Uncharacterized protein n=1 Tax=[Myrmecia] bisecta TaxID=41462 RepID=A0AAW1R648_9CHLO
MLAMLQTWAHQCGEHGWQLTAGQAQPAQIVYYTDTESSSYDQFLVPLKAAAASAVKQDSQLHDWAEALQPAACTPPVAAVDLDGASGGAEPAGAPRAAPANFDYFLSMSPSPSQQGPAPGSRLERKTLPIPRAQPVLLPRIPCINPAHPSLDAQRGPATCQQAVPAVQDQRLEHGLPTAAHSLQIRPPMENLPAPAAAVSASSGRQLIWGA